MFRRSVDIKLIIRIKISIGIGNSINWTLLEFRKVDRERGAQCKVSLSSRYYLP